MNHSWTWSIQVIKQLLKSNGIAEIIKQIADIMWDFHLYGDCYLYMNMPIWGCYIFTCHLSTSLASSVFEKKVLLTLNTPN